MAWNTTSKTSEFSAGNLISSQMEGRGNRDYNGVGLGDVFSSIASSSQYSIVGIKASEVEPMREEIRAYVDNIYSHLEDAIVKAHTSMDKAFRGAELQDAVKTYLNKVKDYCDNLVSHLLTFSDKLADVSNAWQDAQRQMGSSVNDATGSFSAGSKYVDNMATNSRSTSSVGATVAAAAAAAASIGSN